MSSGLDQTQDLWRLPPLIRCPGYTQHLEIDLPISSRSDTFQRLAYCIQTHQAQGKAREHPTKQDEREDQCDIPPEQSRTKAHVHMWLAMHMSV
jgi:hypothetical protein